ncbi:MAG: YqeG family HAD IIIA-type phosphatase, partial [Oscillospiraceae bacterium]
MFILFPHKLFKIITDIPYSYFKDLGIDTIILDVDNTLTTHNNPEPAKGVCDWLIDLKRQGLKLMILSNMKPHRVLP